MENLGLALQISGVGILVLLAVLALFAGLISLLTRILKDKPKEESERGDELEAAAESPSDETHLAQVAAMAVALARAQSAFSNAPQNTGSALSSWGQFHLNRRLNTSEISRRTK